MPFTLIAGEMVEIPPPYPTTGGEASNARLVTVGTKALEAEGGLYYQTWGAGVTYTVPDTTAKDGTQWIILTPGLALTVASVSGPSSSVQIQWAGLTTAANKTLAAGLYKTVKIVKVSATVIRIYAVLANLAEVTGPPPSGQDTLPFLLLGSVRGAASSPNTVTLTGAKKGQKVIAALAQSHSDHSLAFDPLLHAPALSAIFEAEITTDDQIQQVTGAGDQSGTDFTFFLTI